MEYPTDKIKLKKGKYMNIKYTDFGQILIDNQIYGHDMVLNNGTPEKRQKKRSRSLKGQYGHTPLGPRENIPWNCSELVIGTGYYGNLPITEAVKKEAKNRGVNLKIMKTADACNYLLRNQVGANAVLHVTC